MKNKQIISFQDISVTRSELMGYAILFVMFAHAAKWSGIESLRFISSQLTSLMHTPGFLFLSGFSIAYALNKKPSIQEFYTRRIRRLMIPFFVVTSPVFLYLYLMGDSLTNFLLNVSTLRFWVDSNFAGMWYISTTIVLYALSPLFYKVIDTKHPRLMCVVMTALITLLGYLIYEVYPSYYWSHEISLAKWCMYVLGLTIGYLNIRIGGGIFLKHIVYILLMWVALYMLSRYDIFFKIYYGHCRTLLGITFLTYFYSKTNQSKLNVLNDFFKWLGTYSLELYLIHMVLKEFLFGLFNVTSETTPSLLYAIIIFDLILAVILCKPVSIIINRITSKLI